MNSITDPYGYTPFEASLMGASFVVVGVTGAMVSSVFLDKYQCYNAMLRTSAAGSALTGAVMFWSLPHGNTPIFCANIGVLGLFLLPTISIGYSFCAELAYPVSEALSTGLMMLSSQLAGTVVSYVATAIIDAVSPLACLAMLLTQFVLALLMSLWVKEDLRRLNVGRDDLKRMAAEGTLDLIRD